MVSCKHYVREKVYRFKFLDSKKLESKTLGSKVIVDMIYKELDRNLISNNTISALKKIKLNVDKYIDLEFFEYVNLEKVFDMSGVLQNMGEAVDIEDYQVFRELIEENNLYFEKEKMHFKFLKCLTDNNEVIYIPLYVGIGTNEPLGFEEQDIKGMKRWYKCDMESDQAYETKGVLKLNRRKGKNIVFKGEGAYGQLDKISIEETYDVQKETIIIAAINPNATKFNIYVQNNNILDGFCEFEYRKRKGKLLNKPIGQIVPEYNSQENLNLECCLLRSISAPKAELVNLSNSIDKEYIRFFSVKWHPFNILSDFGCQKIFENLSNKHVSTHGKGEIAELIECCEMGNIQTIVGDIERLKSYSERLKYANLIFRMLLEKNEFYKILDKI